MLQGVPLLTLRFSKPAALLWLMFLLPITADAQFYNFIPHCKEFRMEYEDSCWVYDSPPVLLNSSAVELRLYKIKEYGAWWFGPYPSVVLRVYTNGRAFQYFIPKELRRQTDLFRIFDIPISDLYFKPALLNGRKIESVYQLSICVNEIWLGKLYYSLPKTCSLPELYPIHSVKGSIYGIIFYQFPAEENRNWIIYESVSPPYHSLPTPVSGDLWNENWTRPQMFR